MHPAPLTVKQLQAWAAQEIAAGHGAAPVVLQRVVEGLPYVQPLRFTMGPRIGQPFGAPAVCYVWTAGPLLAVEPGAPPLWSSS